MGGRAGGEGETHAAVMNDCLRAWLRHRRRPRVRAQTRTNEQTDDIWSQPMWGDGGGGQLTTACKVNAARE